MDIAVLVNLQARRGSQRVAQSCRRILPRARVLASRSLDETRNFAAELKSTPPQLLLSAGGDGTAIALINAMRTLTSDRAPLSALGVLPLGTGNGWAHALGAPRWTRGLAQVAELARRDGPLPLHRFDLVEVLGVMAHFAGTGWDAEIIDDFQAQKTSSGPLPTAARTGLFGYLYGLTTRTIPRHIVEHSPIELELINTGEDAIGISPDGRPIPLPEGKHGASLYRGPVSVCAAGTTPEWGFGFRAFPFAGLVPRRFCMRVYGGSVFHALVNAPRLWRGVHPMPKMYTWMLTRCKAIFSRPVPFQVGGDRMGYRSEVEYSLAPTHIDLLNWRQLG